MNVRVNNEAECENGYENESRAECAIECVAERVVECELNTKNTQKYI